MKHLSSKKNQEVKAWKKLQTAKGRRLANQYMIEGWHLVEEAILASQQISLIMVEEAMIEEVGQRLPQIVSYEYEQVSISREIVEELSNTPSPQGIFAVIDMQVKDVRMDNVEQDSRWILLDGIQDPGNMGTIIRTADAAGYDGIVLGSGCVDVYNDKVIRSTQGSLWHLSIIEKPLEEVIRLLQNHQVKVYAAALDDSALSYREIDHQHSQAYIIGNEGQGISAEILAMADQTVYIPMKGQAESLNAGIAASILMFHSIS